MKNGKKRASNEVYEARAESQQPKQTCGGDAPSATVTYKANGSSGASDSGVSRLMQATEQLVPMFASKKEKKRIKNKSGVNVSRARPNSRGGPRTPVAARPPPSHICTFDDRLRLVVVCAEHGGLPLVLAVILRML